ncbi:hypothetical protein MSG28_014998 [Choristoneura fumiferana]|uniref:Uncharacterized protein n=1 Tax=Choristoneura fumiferana TaxID=7141 RepID=A0ACC0KYH1_CHOFU|nr:hypothetical protein MSG28_014998 [Choristoneura fumiferana]
MENERVGLLMVESLLKESSEQQSPEGNYTWLKSRHIHHDFSEDVEALKPLVLKMTSENCAAIAVKLDNLTETNVTTAVILTNFKRLLLEQHSMQLIEDNVKRAKETKHARKRNRVHPELGAGRQPVVSFILD